MENGNWKQHPTEEGDWQHDSLLRKASSKSASERVLYRRLFSLLLISNVLLVSIVLFSFKTHKLYNNAVLCDPTHTPSPFGKIPSRLVRFEHDHAFDGDPLQRNSPWNDMNPPGRGFIVVRNPDQYNLERGTPLDQPYRNGYVSNGSVPEAGYLPSVFHQLHCMALLKTAITRLHRSGGDAVQNLKIESDQPAKKTIQGLALEHLDHCVEYVRQALMCAGDTTLEPAELDDEGELTHSSSGWGTQHLCRDWDYIYNYSFEHRVSDVTGITG